MDTKFWRATAMLIGTTIGAGMFGIPYVIVKVGLGLGFSYLFSLTVLTLFLNLAYAKVILKIGTEHQLPGYVAAFFGKKGKILGMLTLLVGQYGALLAYIIGVGSFLTVIFDQPSQNILFSTLFFLSAALIVYFGIRLVSELEGVISFLMISLILFLALAALPFLQSHNFSFVYPGKLIDWQLLFLPLGVIFAALAGYAVIPEMVEVLGREKKKLARAVILGTLIPAIVYLIFALSVVGVSGFNTSPEAILGLVPYLSGWIVKLGAFLGILAMASSYFTLAFVLRELFNKDLGVPKNISWALANFLPFLLFLLGAQSFVGVLSSTGLAMGFLNTGLILGMYLRSAKLKV